MRTLHLPRRLALAGLAVAGLVLTGGSAGQAADPFVAGGRSTRALPAPADELARARARGQAVVAALGLPGVSQRVERQVDVFEHRTYDEVTALDAAGREVAIANLELDGSLAMAVSLGWHPSGAAALDGAAAERRATAFARAAGVAVAGRPDVARSAGAGGWSVAWTRTVDGIAVRGDGVRIALWPDGSFHGLTRSERPLDPPPAQRLGSGEARRAAAAAIAARLPGSTGDLAIVASDLAWVAPNDTFGGPRLDAPAETLRLAWVVQFSASGGLADRLRAIEVWLDAGDGQVVGGDVVE